MDNWMSFCAISVWKWVGSSKNFNIQDGFELNCCDNSNLCHDDFIENWCQCGHYAQQSLVENRTSDH